ncbi:RNA-binding protein [Aureitalea marina]|uniref:RNA-binding protein n=2 Tax=Aureitalea marina TaxID=930804 RepID=A0A2S7KTS5_9FLAO|nr:DUF721 domain-containing protein [Aureitalea marina]PQB05996.1 RNA-binding protein [Aureitalea marina]
MAKRKRSEQSMGDALNEILGKGPLSRGLDKVRVAEAWNAVMGPAIEKYTDRIYLENQTLYVSLSSSVLREELSYGREKIVRLLNEQLEKELVKELVLR